MNDSVPYPVVTKTAPTFYFIGVTTGKSAMMRLFPLWARELGHPEVVIEGMDLKLHDEPAAYRRAVAQIKYDALSLGALVTTHKIDLLDTEGARSVLVTPPLTGASSISMLRSCQSRANT